MAFLPRFGSRWSSYIGPISVIPAGLSRHAAVDHSARVVCQKTGGAGGKSVVPWLSLRHDSRIREGVLFHETAPCYSPTIVGPRNPHLLVPQAHSMHARWLAPPHFDPAVHRRSLPSVDHTRPGAGFTSRPDD